MTGGRVRRYLLIAVFCSLAPSVSVWAAAPTITGVSIPNAPMAINDDVVATISVQSDSATTYALSASNIGGYVLGGLSKIDSTTYTATFTVVEGGANYAAAADIPVSVTVTDGSTPDTWTTPISQANDLLDADRPSVLTVGADTSPVYDGDLTQAITVTFSERMSTSAAPTIVFSSGTWTPGAAGAWSSGNTVWTRTFTVTDTNVTVANVTVDVAGAQDAAGNAQQDYAPQAEFDIDTQNPTVSNVVADTSPVCDGDLTQQIAVTFSEAMATSAAPTITFSTGTWTPGAAGVWTVGNTVWTRTYTLTDANVAAANVTVDVTGAEDAAGNVQQDYAPQVEFDIDTQNPTVTGVVASDLLVTDADAGHTMTVITDFSETMSSSATPTFVFAPSIATTLAFSSGTWVDGDTYRATYAVSDGNVDHDSVTVDVINAQDVAGNGQADYTPVHESEIDMQNPTVTIVASDLAIYDGDAGVDRFVVTATYSEAMNAGVTPTLTFTPGVATTLTNPSGAWSGGNTVYTWTYDVADAGVTAADVDLTVSGGQDVAGNTQVSNTNADYVDIDTQNPTVTIAATTSRSTTET